MNNSTNQQTNPPSNPPTTHTNNLQAILSNDQHTTILQSFQNPRVRDIYRNNRVIVDGHRLLPSSTGNIISRQEHNFDGERYPSTNISSPANISSPTNISSPANISSSANISSLATTNNLIETFDCPICLDSVDVNNKCILDCNHEFCNLCVTNHILTSLGNISDMIPVKCPMFSSGCDFLITQDFKNIDTLISSENKNKLEKYTLLKQHIPPENLRYCPNPTCQLPYEFTDNISSSPPTFENSFRYNTICFDCNTHICTFCNTFSHPGISCTTAQRHNQTQNEENNQYIEKYCKHCPHCNAVVQKLQTPEQEEYERVTGMSGGTQDCHHMTCDSCKQDFCWFCLKIYQSTRYYHPECPTSDCNIRFTKSYPHIIGLPPAVFRYIELITYNQYPNQINNTKIFNILNTYVILSTPHDKNPQNTVTIHCDQDGIIKRFNSSLGNFTFKQENKANFT